MRPIGHIANAEHARRFTDYLAANGMATDVDQEDDGGWLVWIVEEEHIDVAKATLDEFVAAPDAPKFHGHDGRAEQMARAEQESQQAYAKRIRTRKSLVPRRVAHGLGPMTMALIVICVGVAFSTGLGRQAGVEDMLYIENPEIPGFLAAVRQGEVWRLISPIFMHFGVTHILFNMMWLSSLGSMIEARCGIRAFAALVFVTGLVSNLAQRILAGSVFFGGMSGVVYALIGYAWIRGKLDPASGMFLDQQSRVMSLIWLVVCMTGMVGPIANTAHFSGLLLGMAWGWIAARRSSGRIE